jgi:hypothetical protein
VKVGERVGEEEGARVGVKEGCHDGESVDVDGAKVGRVVG